MAKYRSPALRRYLVRLGVAMGAYIVTLSAALRFVGEGRLTGPAAYLLAILPGLCIIGVFWAIGRLMVEEKDEYVRLLMVRQSLVATAFTLSIVTMWGFLENFDLVPHVDAYFVSVLWFAGLGGGSCVNSLMQRGRGGEE